MKKVVALGLLLAGCASAPGPESPAEPGPPPAAPIEQAPEAQPQPPRESVAIAGLMESARSDAAAGRLPNAAASIERALRIDPNNAALWVELGEIHLAAGNRSQAASMARKALTLTAGDAGLESRAERLLRAAGSG